jgi:hypothetical protein
MEIDPAFPILLVPLICFGAGGIYMWRRWRGSWRLAALVPAAVIVAGIVALKPFWSHHVAWAGYESVFLIYPIVLVSGALVTGVLILARGAIQSGSRDRSAAS